MSIFYSWPLNCWCTIILAWGVSATPRQHGECMTQQSRCWSQIWTPSDYCQCHHHFLFAVCTEKTCVVAFLSFLLVSFALPFDSSQVAVRLVELSNIQLEETDIQICLPSCLQESWKSCVKVLDRCYNEAIAFTILTHAPDLPASLAYPRPGTPQHPLFYCVTKRLRNSVCKKVSRKDLRFVKEKGL